MEKKSKETKYPEIKTLQETDEDSFASFINDVFLESPEAMWYEDMPTEKELKGLFSAKLDGCKTGSVIDLVYQSGKKLMCEVEIVKIDKDKAVVGIITRSEGMGTGISDTLLQSAEEKARDIGIKVIVAEVKPKNNKAIEFFKRNNFKELGENAGLVTLAKNL